MKPSRSTMPLTTSKGGTVLDWPIESGVAAEFLQQVEGRRKKHRWRRRVVATGSTLVLAGLIAVLWGLPWLRETSAVVTLAAHRETLALLDGSSADLNAATGVRTDFRYGRRIVHLDRGEAFFSVAKDSAHPFLVETPVGTIRVTGTKFNVRLEENGTAEVTLLEGAIVFEGDGKVGRRVELLPSQQFDSARSGVLALATSDLENVTAWRQGRLAFDGLTLAEAAARLSAFHGVRIDVSPAVAGLRPGGSFPVDDLPAILHALEKALTVRVLTNPDGSYRIIAQ